jgi:hypothetical protein
MNEYNTCITQCVQSRIIGVRFPAKAENGFLYHCHRVRLALGPTQAPIQCVPGAVTLGVKRPLSQYVLMAWCFVKQRDYFTLFTYFKLNN